MTEESVLQKHFEKSLRISRKSYFVIAVATIFIVLVSSFHGVTEAWAWELARNLITVDGLILGFTMFSATVLSKRSFNKALYESMIEETADDLLSRASEYKKSKKTVEEWINENLSTWRQTYCDLGAQQGSLVGSLYVSAILILLSIGLAFCLFGVSDTNLKGWSFEELFFFLYYSAVFCFVSGVYSSYHLIAIVLARVMTPPERPSRAIARVLERKMKEQEMESEPKKPRSLAEKSEQETDQ